MEQYLYVKSILCLQCTGIHEEFWENITFTALLNLWTSISAANINLIQQIDYFIMSLMLSGINVIKQINYLFTLESVISLVSDIQFKKKRIPEYRLNMIFLLKFSKIYLLVCWVFLHLLMGLIIVYQGNYFKAVWHRYLFHLWWLLIEMAH